MVDNEIGQEAVPPLGGGNDAPVQTVAVSGAAPLEQVPGQDDDSRLSTVGEGRGESNQTENSGDGVAPGFAPDEPDDGRAEGDWQSRYPDSDAKTAIRFEGGYLAVHFLVCPIIIFVLNSGLLEKWEFLTFLEKGKLIFVVDTLTAWSAGIFGGTLFSIKWLYHSVAKNKWNSDRRLWRVFTPHVSGGIAFVVFVIMTSGLFGFFDVTKLSATPLILAIGFTAGYFSDTAVAKLSEIALSIFGTSSKRA